MKSVLALALLSLLCLAYVVQAEKAEDHELDEIADLVARDGLEMMEDEAAGLTDGEEEEMKRDITKRWFAGPVRIPTPRFPRIPTPRFPLPRIPTPRFPRIRFPRIRFGK